MRGSTSGCRLDNDLKLDSRMYRRVNDDLSFSHPDERPRPAIRKNDPPSACSYTLLISVIHVRVLRLTMLSILQKLTHLQTIVAGVILAPFQ